MTERDLRDLTQKAFDIYDHDGEEAMLAFLIENEKQPQDENDLEQGLYLLDDGTAVEHSGDSHSVYIARYGRNRGQTRPATISINDQPGFINTRTPVLASPTSGDVIKQVLAQAESFARQETGLVFDDDLLTVYDAVKRMPGLDRALRLAIEAENKREPAGRKMADYLDHIVERCAEDAVRLLPRKEFSNLIAAAVHKLEQNGEPAALGTNDTNSV